MGSMSIPFGRLGAMATRRLFAQVCQHLLNSLHFLLQLAKIGFQFSNLFGLRLEPALKMATTAIAPSPTVALTAAFFPTLACAADFPAAAAFLIVVRISTATHRLTPSFWKTVSKFRQEIILSLAGLTDIDHPRMQVVQPQVGQLLYAPGLHQGLAVTMLSVWQYPLRLRLPWGQKTDIDRRSGQSKDRRLLLAGCPDLYRRHFHLGSSPLNLLAGRRLGRKQDTATCWTNLPCLGFRPEGIGPWHPACARRRQTPDRLP